MYDPTIGRWTSQDPLGFQAGDPNLYRYVKNDPTNLTDPSGLAPHPLSTPTDRNAISSADWDTLALAAIRNHIDPNTRLGDIPFARYFEDAVIRMLGQRPYRRAQGPRFDSPARQARPNGRSQVRPDCTLPIRHLPAPAPFGPRPRPITYENSIFIDAKRVNGIINLSSYNYEAVGYADVLARSPAGQQGQFPRVRPVMIFVTTSDTQISQEVVDEFSRQGVVVGQQWVAYDRGANQLYLTPVTILNPNNPRSNASGGLGAPATRWTPNWDLLRPFDN